MEAISVTPIGTVHSSRNHVEDDGWDGETTYVELDPLEFSADALQGLGEFSHVEVLFFMDRVVPSHAETTARHPRGNVAWPKVGIFAQRAKNRPNPIGLTVCEILRVEGRKLHVRGLDAVDGSPVLDIKPWVTEFGPRGPVFQPAWISELMQTYWRP